MTAKTPAEIQIEFLKKLKAEQRSGKSGRLSPRAVKKRGSQRHSLTVSKASWLQLQEGLKKAGVRPRERRRLGDWAVALILAFPPADSMNPKMKAELFQRIQEWTREPSL